MERGTCGKDLSWRLENNTLVISGNGKMDRYSFYSNKRPAPWNKNSVEKIIIEDGVTNIGKSAFKDCIKLKSIVIPNSVIEVGKAAFDDCKSLKEIKIPDGITKIGNFAFCRCASLKEIKIPDGVTEIGDYTFQDCTSLMEMKIPDGVTEIGDLAFCRCASLKEIKIPDGVTEIGYCAFNGCASLKEIKIPDGVTEIGYCAFKGCESLKEITIPYGLKKLGDEVLDGCTSLEKIYYRAGSDFEDILSEGNNAELIPIERLNWKIEGITLTVGGVSEIKDYSTEKPLWNDYLNNIQKIIIEDGVQKISANAFSNCLHLEHLIIPASVKTIGDFAFTISYCGERTINNGKNVIWSLDNGVLLIKKNPAAKSDADFSTGFESWQVVEKNITSVKVERGIVPGKRFFDWLYGLNSNIPVTFS